MTDDDVLMNLSVTDKALLCSGADLWHTAAVGGVASIMMTDGPHGLRRETAGPERGSAPATCFPTASALGSSWDAELVAEVGAALGAEARAQGVAVVLGPGVNIKRSPLCGRNFEYFSEDPHHAGRMGAAMVTGLQSQHVGASVKHFAANNQETDRHRVSADVDERTLREIYLPAFEHVVTTAQPWTVMCAYNRVNGTFASQHRWLLTDVLRDEWGFDGLVMSDWGAVHDRVAALAAGLDLEMPPNAGVSDAAAVAAVADGSLQAAVLDRAAARVLALVARSATGPAPAPDAAAHHALARRAAARSTVLLRNDGGVLPLVDSPGLRVAVVGPFAHTARYQGAGSSLVNPTLVDVPLDELAAALPASTVRYAATAAETAGADVVVAYLGLPDADDAEGYDRTHIDLPPEQPALLAAITDAAPGVPIVAVLANGSAVATHPWERHVAAVVECWLGGQAVGGAVADILTGAVEPAGRLAETIPVRLADVPSTLMFPGEEGHVRYGEGVFVGYRGFDAADRDVAYPFGHGLSYTTFAWSDPAVEIRGSVAGGDLEVTVSVSVAATGARPGREVVQVYVAAPAGPAARPPRELRAFAGVELAPGAHQRVTLRLDGRAFARWSTGHGRWVVDPGTYAVELAASSRDVRFRLHAQLDGDVPQPRLGAMATLREWLADPAGRAALHTVLQERIGSSAVLDDAGMMHGLASFPAAGLAAFVGLRMSAGELDDLGRAVPATHDVNR